MKIIISLFMLLPSFMFSFVSESGDYRAVIALYEKELTQVQDPGPIYQAMAVAYAKAQETQKALFHFLKALNTTKTFNEKPIQPVDEEFFLKAQGYNLSGRNLAEIAKETLQEFLPIHNEHPDYFLLNFAIALAYANLHQWSEFFQRFYSSYLNCPDHYIVHKAKGVLAVKLLESTYEAALRQELRFVAVESFERAIVGNPRDGHLYLLLIAQAKGDADLREKTIEAMTKMVEQKVSFPRRDILPFIKEAVALGKVDLARRLIEQASVDYPYSRAIQEAEQYLERVEKASITQ